MSDNEFMGFVPGDNRNVWRIQENINLSDVEESLPGGLYQLEVGLGGTYFYNRKVVTDKLVSLADQTMSDLNRNISTFYSEETRQVYKDFGQVHRRGILLYGPPGSGKTSIINQIMSRVISEFNGICFINPDPRTFSSVMNRVLTREPNRHLMVVFEDFENKANDSRLLALLDGELKVPNTLYIATTNYVKNLEPRMVNRPSRFAEVIKIGALDAAGRKDFLQAHIPAAYLERVNLDEWAEASDGLMIDHLKHLAQCVFVYGLTLPQACERMRNMGKFDET